MHLYSPISYVGAKTRAVETLGAVLPNDIQTMASIFAGGLSFELYCEHVKKLNVTNAYDKNTELLNFWRVIANPNNAAKMVEDVIKLFPKGIDKPTYWKQRTLLLNHIKGIDVIEDDYQLALLFYISHNFSFARDGCRFHWSRLYEKEKTVKSLLRRLLEFKTNIKFECLGFDESIRRHNDDTFLYLDPPYYIDKQNLTQPLYKHHEEFDHELLASMLKERKGKWLLSYGDCEFVRDTYKDYKLVPVKWWYSMTLAVGTKKESYEVLIMNYDTDTKGIENLFKTR